YSFLDYVNTPAFHTNGEEGMQTDYFNNLHWEGQPKVNRVEKLVNHEWESGQPDIAGLTAGAYSIRWTGTVSPAQSGTYRIALRINHDFRLWLNDKLVLGEHQRNPPVMRKIDLPLEAGKTYTIKLEYSHDTGYAIMALGFYKVQPDFSEAIA